MEHCLDCGCINHAELTQNKQSTFAENIKKILASIRIIGAEDMSKIK